MTRRRFAPLLCAATQLPEPPPAEDRMPNGRRRSEEIRRADFNDNLRDLDDIKKLVEEVRAELEKTDGHVLSLGNLKKLEEVEKRSRRIRARMKRF